MDVLLLCVMTAAGGREEERDAKRACGDSGIPVKERCVCVCVLNEIVSAIIGSDLSECSDSETVMRIAQLLGTLPPFSWPGSLGQ